MPALHINVNVAKQQLQVLDENGKVVFERTVSTAAKGTGQQKDSEQTPLGQHYIRAKIGGGAPPNTVFVARRPTGEIYSSDLRRMHPQRDWILTRILWLCGTERGHNRLGQVDTMRRFIYIHGAPDEDAMGTPSSHGCIKMRNDDVIALFDLVPQGTRVVIKES